SSTAADRGVHSWYADLGISGITQDFVTGAKAERLYGGGEIRYFYNRTYGFEIVYRKEFDYDFTTSDGTKRSTFTKDTVSISALFYPAMNFNFRLLYNPRAQNNRVFKDERDL